MHAAVPGLQSGGRAREGHGDGGNQEDTTGQWPSPYLVCLEIYRFLASYYYQTFLSGRGYPDGGPCGGGGPEAGRGGAGGLHPGPGGHYLLTIYSLSTHYLHTIYTPSTHYLHTI